MQQKKNLKQEKIFFFHNFNPIYTIMLMLMFRIPLINQELNSFSAKHSKSINQLAQLVYMYAKLLSLLDIKDIKVR